MTDAPVRTKSHMYALLASGAFGNTIEQFFSLSQWEASPDYARYGMWGVRTLTPGGPCRLYCPQAEVRQTVEDFQRGGYHINISCMVDAVCTVTLWADVMESESGLIVYGIEYPGKGASWRQDMPRRGGEWRGLAARMLLRRHLNECDLADLEVTLERWPGHVVKLSACDRCLGRIPGRRSIVWEVRNY